MSPQPSPKQVHRNMLDMLIFLGGRGLAQLDLSTIIKVLEPLQTELTYSCAVVCVRLPKVHIGETQAPNSLLIIIRKKGGT